MSHLRSAESVDWSVRLERVSKTFGRENEAVLKDVSASFPSGRCTYILGPSGVGKSVIFKLILGLLKPDTGKIWVGDQDVASLRGNDFAKMRFLFGALFQNMALFDDLSVLDNIAFPLREHTSLGEKEIREKVESSLAKFGMRGGLDKFPNELSGGMRKRVALARAIIREPRILLCDEPTTGLDPVTRASVDELFATLKKEFRLTLIIISHDVSSALELADQIVFLSQGKIVFSGSPKEFVHAEHSLIREFIAVERRAIEAVRGIGA